MIKNGIFQGENFEYIDIVTNYGKIARLALGL